MIFVIGFIIGIIAEQRNFVFHWEMRYFYFNQSLIRLIVYMAAEKPWRRAKYKLPLSVSFGDN